MLTVCPAEVPCWENLDQAPRRRQPAASVASLWTETVVSELKAQSIAGCLLCSLEEWDEEDEERG